MTEIAKRNRTNPMQFYLSDDEQYILNTKFKASGMKSMSAFLRKLILYGYVYDVDYSYLRNYNTELGRISSSLNQIAKRVNSTGNIYREDMLSSTKPTVPTISLTRKPRTQTLISANTRARSSYMVEQGVYLSRQASS